MIDIITKKQVCVEHNNINLSVQQVSVVCSLLDKNNISYHLEDDAISIDRGPEMTNITIHNNKDSIFVQKLLNEQKEDKNKLPQIIIQGKQIGFGRRAIIDRAIDIILTDSKDIDWQKHDLSIQIIIKMEK
jgi:glutaredoxin